MGNLDDITVAENLRQDKSAPSSPTKSQQQQQQATTANNNVNENSFDQSTSNVEFSLSQFEMKKTVGKGAFGHVRYIKVVYTREYIYYMSLVYAYRIYLCACILLYIPL